MKERDLVFDNIKGYMLFLVAFGHVIDAYCSSDHNLLLYDTMKYIYLFHMPMFAFITGYFTKDYEKARNKAFKSILVPYLLFQTVYVVLAALMIKMGLATFNADVFNYSILLPSSAFYYLLATFFWKVFVKDLMRVRYVFLISLILGLGISLTRSKEFHIGYGAVFSLLPFFVAGALLSKTEVEKIRRLPHFLAILVLILGVIPAVYFPYAIHSVRFTYEAQGFTNLMGLGWRIVYYLIAFLMCFAIINITPNRKSIFCKIGAKSILVYAGSTFLSPSLYILVDSVLHISNNYIMNTICMVLFSFLIILFMSMGFVDNIYRIVVGLIYKLLIKNDMEPE